MSRLTGAHTLSLWSPNAHDARLRLVTHFERYFRVHLSSLTAYTLAFGLVWADFRMHRPRVVLVSSVVAGGVPMAPNPSSAQKWVGAAVAVSVWRRISGPVLSVHAQDLVLPAPDIVASRTTAAYPSYKNIQLVQMTSKTSMRGVSMRRRRNSAPPSTRGRL